MDDDSDQKKYPLTLAVQPKLDLKFAPNAMLTIQDKVYFIQQENKDGFRNELGFRFALAF
ncbi:MAG: hypothetical protein LBJ41_00845 [Treponema sp.]|nr:hypothetical protein [Treponema sp.]